MGLTLTREFGLAVAVKYLDGGFIHARRGFGLAVDDLGSLDALLRFYREDGQRCDFQLNDHFLEPETALRLAEKSLLVTSPISTDMASRRPPRPRLRASRCCGRTARRASSASSSS